MKYLTIISHHFYRDRYSNEVIIPLDISISDIVGIASKKLVCSANPPGMCSKLLIDR